MSRTVYSTSTRCPSCRGGNLFRPDCGASRMSAYMGRVLLRCDSCGKSWSARVESRTEKLYREGVRRG